MLAVDEEIITAVPRFGLHAVRRKKGADVPGAFAEKQQSSGLPEQLMKTSDKSVRMSRRALRRMSENSC